MPNCHGKIRLVTTSWGNGNKRAQRAGKERGVAWQRARESVGIRGLSLSPAAPADAFAGESDTRGGGGHGSQWNGLCARGGVREGACARGGGAEKAGMAPGVVRSFFVSSSGGLSGHCAQCAARHALRPPR